MLVKLILCIFCLAIVISCKQSSSVLSDTDRKNIVSDIQQTLLHYFKDIKEKGIKAEFAYLDSSADFFWVPPGRSISIGFDSVAAILNRGADRYRSIDNTFDTLQIFPINSELASYSGKVHSIITDTAGKTGTYQLVETGMMIKRKDGWKLLSGQTSLIPAPH